MGHRNARSLAIDQHAGGNSDRPDSNDREYLPLHRHHGLSQKRAPHRLGAYDDIRGQVHGEAARDPVFQLRPAEQ